MHFWRPILNVGVYIATDVIHLVKLKNVLVNIIRDQYKLAINIQEDPRRAAHIIMGRLYVHR